MIHDVARLARHCRAREEALGALCRSLADRDGIDPDTARVLGMVSQNCSHRADAWSDRAPDADYVAVGRPAAPHESEPDAVLDLLASHQSGDLEEGQHLASRALADMVAAYRAQLSVTDLRLDGPTAEILSRCVESATSDASVMATRR